MKMCCMAGIKNVEASRPGGAFKRHIGALGESYAIKAYVVLSRVHDSSPVGEVALRPPIDNVVITAYICCISGIFPASR